jgi:hypothetical protein
MRVYGRENNAKICEKEHEKRSNMVEFGSTKYQRKGTEIGKESYLRDGDTIYEGGEKRRWRRKIIGTECLVDNGGFAHREIIVEDNDMYLEKTLNFYELSC